MAAVRSLVIHPRPTQTQIRQVSMSQIRGVSFDFDGVLVQSNTLKRDGFFTLVQEIPRGGEIMEEILATTQGDRYDIWRDFAVQIGQSEAWGREMIERYAAWCLHGITTCPTVAGAESALSTLRQHRLPIYINSATPQTPLREGVIARGWREWFIDIYGRPASKEENLHRILKQEGLAPEQLAHVGDGENDFEAAQTLGCPFIGVVSLGSTLRSGRDQALTDLSTLPHLLGVTPHSL